MAELTTSDLVAAFLSSEGIPFKVIEGSDALKATNGKARKAFIVSILRTPATLVDIYEAVDFVRNNALRRL